MSGSGSGTQPVTPGNLDVSVARATLASFVVVCPATLGLAPEVSRVFFPPPGRVRPSLPVDHTIQTALVTIQTHSTDATTVKPLPHFKVK